MKYLKMLGLAAVAAAALTAFVGAGTASANTVLCHTTVTTGCAAAGWDWGTGKVLDTSLASGGTARLTDTSGFIAIATCTGGTVEGELNRTTTPRGAVTAANVTWSGCSQTTDTLTGGELEIHHIAGTHNGTVTATGFAVTVPFGSATCAYGFNAARDIGTLTTSANGLDASLSINVAVNLDANHSSASGCPSSGKWIATYTQTTNTALYIAES